MCGVAGILGPGCGTSRDPGFRSMLAGMEHRGPDAVGDADLTDAVLGFTRLAIIDVDARSNQPMRFESLALVFNGEIYNYLELRGELERLGHQFSTTGDAEVLLHAWSEWGERCLERLIGMFAFVLVDERDRSAVLVRDPFGIKPLFYGAEGARILFASDPVVVAQALARTPAADAGRVIEYLVRGRYDHGEGSFYDGVRQVPPAGLLRVDLAHGRITGQRRWWSPVIDEEPVTRAAAVVRLREMLLDSIRLHLRTDVPWGVALSGGVDSSTIACSVRNVTLTAEIHAFSFVAPGYANDESHWIDRVAEATGAAVHRTSSAQAPDMDELDDLVLSQGEPFGSTSIYAQYRVFKLAREAGVKVVLEGQGADELFAGYNGYPGARMMSMIEGGRLIAAARFARRWRTWPGREDVDAILAFGAIAARGRGPAALYGFASPKAPPWIHTAAAGSGCIAGWERAGAHVTRAGRRRRLAEHERHTILDDGLRQLLRHGDRNSMRWSIESRVPFLTTPIAEFALRLPEAYLIDDAGQTKSVLREAMEGIVPDDVLYRRDKVGFETPERSWVAESVSIFREWVADAPPQPFIDVVALGRHLDAIAVGSLPYSTSVWRSLNLLRWLRLAPVRIS